MAYQTAGRHNDPQLHGTGIAACVLLRAGYLRDHDAVPRAIVSVLVLRTVQHYLGIHLVALYQLHHRLLRIVGVTAIGKPSLLQSGLVDDIALGILQQHAELIHQRQDIQCRILCHGSLHRRRCILQIPHTALEGN